MSIILSSQKRFCFINLETSLVERHHTHRPPMNRLHLPSFVPMPSHYLMSTAIHHIRLNLYDRVVVGREECHHFQLQSHSFHCGLPPKSVQTRGPCLRESVVPLRALRIPILTVPT